ncbi:MAG: outer membrane protein assembly factor BamA [Alphaproteobacteria bacterium]|nr:outer membrane protein assembly factor BamA [Alphaproteobacteria bacterium]
MRTLLAIATGACAFSVAAAQAPGPVQAPAQGAAAAGAEQPGEHTPIIRAIQVQGNQRIEADTVASYLVVQPGQQADDQLLDLGLKTLFNTGLFSDVQLNMLDDGTLRIEVEENPIVNRVILEGNKRVKDDKITEEVQLTARSVFTRAKVQSDVQRIIEVYRRTGRFAAEVTPKVTPLEQNRVDVIYEIDEGPKTGVAKINFIGNEAFSSNALRGEILTKESRWWRFFSSNANYDPDRLEYERDLLRQFYARNGYADFQVVSAIAELTPDREDFFITFSVDEGPQYTVGEVRVKTTLDRLDETALESIVPIRTGETFDGDKVKSATESITFATGALGYAFVDVRSRLERNPDTKTVDIIFQVNEGPRVYVEKINIKGNTRTLDKVIRREVRLAEGDAFNRVLVDRSKARIRSLQYFSEVEIEEKPGSGPDRTEVDVTVEEQSTGSFSVGVGVSSTENFIVDFSIQERNLMGRGQFLQLRAQASSRTRQIDLRFTQPYFLDRNLAAGFSIFNTRTDFREVGIIRNRVGFGLNAGFQISEYGRGSLQYQLARDNITFDQISNRTFPIGTDPMDVLVDGASPTAPPVTGTDAFGEPALIIQAETCDFLVNSFSSSCSSRGRFITSLIGYSVQFDTRDDPIDPTRGWQLQFSQGFAGLGGDVNYIRNEGLAASYQRLFGGFVLRTRFRGGYISGYAGDDVRVQDRFFEGASTFRGFEVAGVGPRFISEQSFIDRNGQLVGTQAIGAKIYAIGTAEIRLPLPLPKEYGIRAAIFTDFGTVGLVDERDKIVNDNISLFVDPDGDGIFVEPVQDDLSVRISAGVSVSWDSPFGPVRFDIAEVFRKEDYDRTEGFRFSAGTNF